MADFDFLSDKLKKLCKPRKTKHGELGKDLSASVDKELFFLTNIFTDGSFLGFWSHSPWGLCRDQEQGWVVLSPELEVLDTCETRTSGRSAGNNFAKWRKRQTMEHGKSHKLMEEFGEHYLRDRVRTHRGFHCGECGKRF